MKTEIIKIIAITVLVITMAYACKKDEPQPEPPKKDCGCFGKEMNDCLNSTYCQWSAVGKCRCI